MLPKQKKIVSRLPSWSPSSIYHKLESVLPKQCLICSLPGPLTSAPLLSESVFTNLSQPPQWETKANFLSRSLAACGPPPAPFVKTCSSLAFGDTTLPSHSPFPCSLLLAGFFFCPFPILTFWAGSVVVVRGCHVHCRRFNSIPGLYSSPDL